MELLEYREMVLEDIKYNVSNEGTNDQEEFLAYVTDTLKDAEEIEEFNYLHYEGVGRRGKKIQLDGYSYNELDDCLTLFVCTPISYLECDTLTATEAEKIFSRVIAFVEESSFILDNAEESSAGYGLAYDLKHKYKNINNYRIFLITSNIMSSKIKDLKAGSIGSTIVEKHIWDIKRLFQLYQSSSGKEDIVIDLEEFVKNGIPSLEANTTDDYKAYLCNIPGLTLAKLYNTYGSRLLEGNVRSFLQTKGKVNKGIRYTILNEPDKFFAYNNGIAATATDIKTKLVDGRLYITEITCLQIVNGGQTTASLAMAYLNDKKDNSEEQIAKISVPMKLSIVSPEKAEELIPNISRYANSQNKVSDADLWSNHPFHILMEEFSRKIVTPALNGKQYGTHWYYERANGQYKQETYKSSKADKKAFEDKNPPKQMFKKVDLAKYWNIKDLRPDIASAGGQKAFSRFAKYINSKWEKDNTIFNKGFFEDVVSLAIIFKGADKIVRQQPWYNSYKANIVAYTMSIIFYKVEQLYPDHVISLHNIRLKQELSDAWISQITKLSKIIYEFLIDDDREVENVTEWAKREACWNKAKELKITFIPEFVNELEYKSNYELDKKDNKKEQKLENQVKKMAFVAEYGLENWEKLYQWNTSHNVLNPIDLQFLKLALDMAKGKFPSEKQCAKIIAVLEKARIEGFPL